MKLIGVRGNTWGERTSYHVAEVYGVCENIVLHQDINNKRRMIFAVLLKDAPLKFSSIDKNVRIGKKLLAMLGPLCKGKNEEELRSSKLRSFYEICKKHSKAKDVLAEASKVIGPLALTLNN